MHPLLMEQAVKDRISELRRDAERAPLRHGRRRSRQLALTALMARFRRLRQPDRRTAASYQMNHMP